ncbi:hypothetical protein ACH4CD_26720 [Streptomyces fungicidicus]|uniref:hypothetical protein n=1 Tax=Streptomyces fungicidicus TaxID=68203 RepID=UPI00379FC4F3
MRLHRVAPGIAAGILAPVLLLAALPFAATAAPTAVTVPAVSSSADEPDAEDLRVAMVRVLADPDSGRRVTPEANALLDASDPKPMRARLETGYRFAEAEDDRVDIARIEDVLGTPATDTTTPGGGFGHQLAAAPTLTDGRRAFVTATPTTTR